MSCEKSFYVICFKRNNCVVKLFLCHSFKEKQLCCKNSFYVIYLKRKNYVVKTIFNVC